MSRIHIDAAPAQFADLEGEGDYDRTVTTRRGEAVPEGNALNWWFRAGNTVLFRNPQRLWKTLI
ncbi:hypothetical protein JQ615_38905 [Bradyrhizobium jicamae]|uniref:Uncharacterized protein n=1 Tax=Bradyrhizobium jicamae TaxID=280332 RepID=A0ABS5FWV6_9BRAD|nr:hypothetical protein [Bradyrhizobium jicamae]